MNYSNSVKQKSAVKEDTTVKDMPPAFVTYGWCRSAYAAVWSLGRRGIDVHVGDSSSTAMSRFSRYCKSFTKLPDFFAEPDKYFDAVCEAMEKTGAKVLLPCHEDVEIFSQRLLSLPDDVKVAIPDGDMCSLVNDKYAFMEYVQKNNCPVPKSEEVFNREQLKDTADRLGWPVVIKTRVGNSAKGVRIVSDYEELKKEFFGFVDQYKLSNDRWPILQEYVKGGIVSVWALYDKGSYVSNVNVRFLRCKESGLLGTSTFREVIDSEIITTLTKRALDALNWHGVANLDFIYSDGDEPKLLEINIRLGGATAITMFSGVDYPYLWYQVALGHPIVDRVQPNRIVKSRWFIGECLALCNRLKRAKFREALQIFVPQRNCYLDDFNIKDPAPFFFEGLDYLSKFIKARGSLNPVTKNMIR
ncbi:MAG: ATP-grasp domain-containing protein [Anaerohalosphaera sp.]|nr:ATP-grasp domain-containing protein [Anaerohalosphaera sp.]